MALIDFHVHATPKPDTSMDMRLTEHGDVNAYLHELDKQLALHGIERALVHLLDERCIAQLKGVPSRCVLSLMVDFRKPGAPETVRYAKAAGVAGIKILTYEQEVTPNDYPAVLRLAQEVERQGLFLTVCCTFGSKKLHTHDALALVSYLLQKGFSAPLIMAHGGGSRAREALLLMDDAPNLYLDTSFTTTYWKGSPVMDELAYVIQRFPDRCFFGSDVPYVPWEQARADAAILLDKLAPAVREKVWHANAQAFLRRWKP